MEHNGFLTSVMVLFLIFYFCIIYTIFKKEHKKRFKKKLKKKFKEKVRKKYKIII